MDDELHNGRSKVGFVGLHRKWLLTLSLLLLIMSATFGALNYWYLKVQVKTQQEASQSAWRAEFKGLIDHSVDRLQRLSIVLASLGKLTEHLIQPGAAITTAELEEQFSSVRYELDVERLMVFDNDGNIRWNWSPDSSNPVSLQPMIDIIARVRNTEKPEASLDCQSQCELNIVMPLLKDGKHVGFIGLSQRITDLVVEFSTATGVDIGLLIPAGNVDEKTFPRWRLYAAALTHAKKLRPLLEYLSERYASPADIPRDEGLPWQEAFYVFDTLPLNGIIKGANGYLVFISNVSEATSALK